MDKSINEYVEGADLHFENAIYEDEMFDNVVKYAFVGSRVVVSPPPMDTDRDVLILVRCRRQFGSNLLKNGWSSCLENGGDGMSDGTGLYISEGGKFRAYRKGEDNLIITECVDWFDTFLHSTYIAKVNKIYNKSLRVRLFSTIRGIVKEYNTFHK